MHDGIKDNFHFVGSAERIRIEYGPVRTVVDLKVLTVRSVVLIDTVSAHSLIHVRRKFDTPVGAWVSNIDPQLIVINLSMAGMDDHDSLAKFNLCSESDHNSDIGR